MEPDGIIEVSFEQRQNFLLIKLKIIIILFIKQSNWNEIADNFDEMNLREDLLRGIYAYGFEKPSAIQQRAIIPCIRGECPYIYIYQL